MAAQALELSIDDRQLLRDAIGSVHVAVPREPVQVRLEQQLNSFLNGKHSSHAHKLRENIFNDDAPLLERFTRAQLVRLHRQNERIRGVFLEQADDFLEGSRDPCEEAEGIAYVCVIQWWRRDAARLELLDAHRPGMLECVAHEHAQRRRRLEDVL